MKLISWNVNGLRACLGKGFLEFFREADADCFCLQETKMQPGQAEVPVDGYHQYWNSAEKKGYSGTALFTKKEPIRVTYGIGVEQFDHEGRVITAEFEELYLVTVYTPNSQRGLERLSYRQQWEDEFRRYVKRLDETKPVVICGDLNVAHQPIDLKNPKTNERNAGYTVEERQKMTELLESGFTDSFRYLYPDRTEAYSWWSYMFHARENNAGWRIDYFLVSNRLADKIAASEIYAQVMGSDHCPVGLVLETK